MHPLLSNLLGVLRAVAVVVVLLVGIVALVIAGLLPVRVRGVGLALWVVVGLVRIFLWIGRVHVLCSDGTALAAHRGLVFPNHVSLLDPLILYYFGPARFLSAAEVLDYPVIGWAAQRIGTVFVARSSERARRLARKDIAAAVEASPNSPIVLFPEGKLGRGDRLHPFHRGAFEVAAQHRIPYLPVALRYSPLDVATWHGGAGEEIYSALWRLLAFPGPMRAEVIVCNPVIPLPDDDAGRLADMARQEIAAALGLPADDAAHTPSPSLNS